MKKTYQTLLLTLIFIFSFHLMNSQVSTSFQTNANLSKIGLGYNFNEKLWGELRIYSGTLIEKITPEIVLNYNFLQKEHFKTYFGGGVVLNYFNAIVSQVGIQIQPFDNLKNFSFVLEAQPQYNWDYEDFYFNAFGGIRYKFK